MSGKLGQVVTSINDTLIEQIGTVDNYLTGIMLRFSGDIVDYVNAGHTELLYRKKTTGNVCTVRPKDRDIKGVFLGIESMRTNYSSLSFKVSTGDMILLYTDCFNESENTAGEQYGNIAYQQCV